MLGHCVSGLLQITLLAQLYVCWHRLSQGLILGVPWRGRQKDPSRQVQGNWLPYSFYPLPLSCRGCGDAWATLNTVG